MGFIGEPGTIRRVEFVDPNEVPAPAEAPQPEAVPENEPEKVSA